MPRLAQFACDRCGKTATMPDGTLMPLGNGRDDDAPMLWSIVKLETGRQEDGGGYRKTSVSAFLCDVCTPAAIAFISAASPAASA